MTARLALLALACFAANLAAAQTVLISSFASAPAGEYFTEVGSWTGELTTNGGTLRIGPASGPGSADATGYFTEAAMATTFNATGFGFITVTAALTNSDHVASGFVVNLFDSNGNGALSATFSSSSFNLAGFATVSAALSAHPGNGNITDIASFGLAGNGVSGAFRMTFDQISASTTAVPEPSTFALAAGLAALAVARLLRRRRASTS